MYILCLFLYQMHPNHHQIFWIAELWSSNFLKMIPKYLQILLLQNLWPKDRGKKWYVLCPMGLICQLSVLIWVKTLGWLLSWAILIFPLTQWKKIFISVIKWIDSGLTTELLRCNPPYLAGIIFLTQLINGRADNCQITCNSEFLPHNYLALPLKYLQFHLNFLAIE